MWQAVVSALLGKLPEKAAEYYTKKMELRNQLKITKLEGKIHVEKARAEAQAEREKRESEWEGKSIDNSGWKDEYWTVVLSSPLVLIFFPFFQPYIAQGFVELEKAPEWYLVALGAAIAAAFGVRPVIQYFTRRKK